MTEEHFKAIDGSRPEVIGDRTIRFTATSEVEDRDDDIVRVSGLKIDNFRKNPVFLWAHDDKHPPVGKIVDIQKRPIEGELIVDVKFFDGEFADKIFRQYKEGFLNTVSISFDPLDFAEREEGGFDFIESELLEVSAVPIPANPEATAHRSKLVGKQSKAIRKWARRILKQTDFPSEGDDQKVSLQNSEYDRLPLDFVTRIKEDHPDIWSEGGNIQGGDSFEVLRTVIESNNGAVETDKQEEIVRKREAWAARHEKDFRLPGVVAQLKWFVVGSRGLDHQREVINEAIEDKKSMDIELDKGIEKGESLSTFLRTLVGVRLEEGQPQAEILSQIQELDENDPAMSTIRSYMNGEVQCPPDSFLVAASEALGVQLDTLSAMAARDGCDVDVTAFPEEETEEGGVPTDADKRLSGIESKAVTEFQNFPIGDDYEEEWTSDVAVQQAREHASSDDSGDKETIDWGTYQEHFLIYDSDNPEQFGSYSFPYVYHDEDGSMYVPPQSIFSAAGFLAQGEEGVNEFDDGDLETAVEHINRYYDKLQDKFPERAPESPLRDEEDGMDEKIKEEIEELKSMVKQLVDEPDEQEAEVEDEEVEPEDKSADETDDEHADIDEEDSTIEFTVV